MPQNAELSSSRVIGEINLLKRNEVGVWGEAGRKKRVSLRNRLGHGQEGVKQSSLNSKRKPGRVNLMQFECLVLQNPARMVHPQKMCFQAKHQIFLPTAHAFPCLSLPSYRNSSSSQEQIIKKLLFVCAYFKHCDNAWINVGSCEKRFKSQTY